MEILSLVGDLNEILILVAVSSHIMRNAPELGVAQTHEIESSRTNLVLVSPVDIKFARKSDRD